MGRPFFMSFRNQKYYVYVKNVSSAYFSDRDKTTRAQLPIKPAFDSIKSSPYPFIFLGYDGLNDVFICWNYHIAKERLNVGKSVSFYSRTFFQSEVKEGEFIRRKLKNGDIPVLFKRSDLIEFFKKIDTFFPIENTSKFNYTVNIGNHDYEVEFKEYLKINRKLSDKSIKNYANALKGRISEGLKKHFMPSLETIFLIDNVSFLEELNVKLFEKEEYLVFVGEFLNEYSIYIFDLIYKYNSLFNSDLKIKIIGNKLINQERILSKMIDAETLGIIEFIDHINQKDLYSFIKKSKAGILMTNYLWWCTFAKMVDYIALQVPVIALVPEISEARTQLTKANLGVFLTNDIEKDLKKMNDFLQNNQIKAKTEFCSHYLATSQVNKFIQIIAEL